MLSRSYLSSKLSDFLFLNINHISLSKLFNMDLEEDIYLPLRSENIIEGVKTNNSFDEIPVKNFIEGMCYVIGCDENFKHSSIYKDILDKNEWCISAVKGIIVKHIQNDNYLDGYLLLRGVYTLEGTEEIYNKLLWCLYNEQKKDSNLLEELNNVIQYGKKLQYAQAFFYESLRLNEEGDFISARDNINLYYSFGGEDNDEIREFGERLKLLGDFQLGRENTQLNPKYALELLLPLLDEMEENASIYLYIAVAYRNIEIYQKAIYYLNEAIRIDSNLVDVFNELGLNYACLNDYDTAILYFRKVFEVTKSIEICTNLIMCYIKKGDINQANIHFDLAKKIDSKDEVLGEIEILLRGNKTNDGD